MKENKNQFRIKKNNPLNKTKAKIYPPSTQTHMTKCQLEEKNLIFPNSQKINPNNPKKLLNRNLKKPNPL